MPNESRSSLNDSLVNRNKLKHAPAIKSRVHIFPEIGLPGSKLKTQQNLFFPLVIEANI
jgi:hypothetical protein